MDSQGTTIEDGQVVWFVDSVGKTRPGIAVAVFNGGRAALVLEGTSQSHWQHTCRTLLRVQRGTRVHRWLRLNPAYESTWFFDREEALAVLESMSLKSRGPHVPDGPHADEPRFVLERDLETIQAWAFPTIHDSKSPRFLAAQAAIAPPASPPPPIKSV